MVEAVRQLLINATKTPEVSPCLRICRRCKGLIMKMQNRSYRRTATGELPAGDDASEDRMNDGIDALKGIVASGFLRNQESTIKICGAAAHRYHQPTYESGVHKTLALIREMNGG